MQRGGNPRPSEGSGAPEGALTNRKAHQVVFTFLYVALKALRRRSWNRPTFFFPLLFNFLLQNILKINKSRNNMTNSSVPVT